MVAGAPPGNRLHQSFTMQEPHRSNLSDRLCRGFTSIEESPVKWALLKPAAAGGDVLKTRRTGKTGSSRRKPRPQGRSMSFTVSRRAISLVAAVLGGGLALMVMMTGSAQAAAFGMQPYYAIKLALEPFGRGGETLRSGGLQHKWHTITVALRSERGVLAQCRADMESCPSAARRFLAVIDKAQAREGEIRIAELNRAINLSIRPVSDMEQYGVEEFWASPLTAFSSGAGDCEDYAIAKYAALRELGFSADDVRLVVVHDRASNEDHAVAAVRYQGRWLILDNRTLAVRADAEITTFKPLFVLNDQGVKRLVPATAPAPMPAPAVQPSAENPLVASVAPSVAEPVSASGSPMPLLL
jgi:predicted transglutaminase-like cysteine proteinase